MSSPCASSAGTVAFTMSIVFWLSSAVMQHPFRRDPVRRGNMRGIRSIPTRLHANRVLAGDLGGLVKTCKSHTCISVPVLRDTEPMRLTRHTDYALRVLMYLSAEPDRLASIGEMSAAYGISHN